jgi:hypothetical protein
MAQASLSNGSDSVTFESYDDQDFGYTRIIADSRQLQIEYHPASDTGAAKTPMTRSPSISRRANWCITFRR